MKINPHIFRIYDIRGKYPEDLSQEIVYKIALGYAKLFPDLKKIVIQTDVRKSGQDLKKGLIKGLKEEGKKIIDIGTGPIPLMYFSVCHYPYDGGITITASHLGKEYNGLKMQTRNAYPVITKDLEKIKEMVINKTGGRKNERPKTDTSSLNPEPDYIDYLCKKIKLKKPLKIIIDTGNGACGLLPEKIFKKLGCDAKTLFSKYDDSFPNHIPDPYEEKNLAVLKKEVLKEKADLGLGFDGDGDRVIFLDERGGMVKTEFILGLYAEKQMKDGINPHTKTSENLILRKAHRSFGVGVKTSVVMPVNTSRGVREYLEKTGVKVNIIRVGYTFIQRALKKPEINLGAEISGHLYFKDFFGIDSGLRALLKLSAIVAEAKQPLSGLVSKFETYVNSGEINFEVKDKKKVLKEVKKKYKDAKISTLDGVTVEYQDWWFNIRPSNTEPLIRFVLEAKDRELLDNKIKEIKHILTKG